MSSPPSRANSHTPAHQHYGAPFYWSRFAPGVSEKTTGRYVEVTAILASGEQIHGLAKLEDALALADDEAA